MQLLIGDFQLREKLKDLAYNDELTGVKNRRVIKELEKQQGALVMIDLDKFKYINDTLGHEAGDKMLKDFTFMAEKVLRAEDTILRYGGDEFLLVLKDVDVGQAKNVVKRLREYSLRNSISFSAGIAKLKSSINESIKLADEAMYRAKRSEKGICIAKEEEAN
jgi:two-component system cell cycle response regulator